MYLFLKILIYYYKNFVINSYMYLQMSSVYFSNVIRIYFLLN